MAASVVFGRATSKVLKGLLQSRASVVSYSNKRYLLSQAYSCKEAWNKRLDDPVLSQIPLSEFAVHLRDQFEKQKSISAVDMEILANKLHEMEIEEAEFMEDLMIKFRKSPASRPVKDYIVYVIVRSYIENNMADRLLPLMQARSQTGIFPDSTAFSLLLDYFIERKDFASAAQVAYELMLQEDFSHPTSYLLTLYASVHYLESVSLDDIKPEDIKEPEGEEDWIPVKYIRYPTYDDHFDIKWHQYLLGKTLYLLGKRMSAGTLAASLQVTGLALYHKFDHCLRLLAELANSSDALLVQDSLRYIAESLERVQTRDPEKPEKEIGLLTIDDEIYKLLPTEAEKDVFVNQLKQLQQILQDKGKLVEDKLSELAVTLVNNELAQHETADEQIQTERLERWRIDRQTLLQQQLYQLEKKEKIEKIERTLKELQEKEEMLRFFECNDKIRLAQPKKLPEDPPDAKELLERLSTKRIKR